MTAVARLRSPEVVGLAPTGTHVVALDDDGGLCRWNVRGWFSDGRPAAYDPRVGRLVPLDATGRYLHDPPDELYGCEPCARMKISARENRKTLRAVD